MSWRELSRLPKIPISSLRFAPRFQKIVSSYMESQDSATLFLFKIWPTIEANKNRFIGGAVAVVLIVLFFIFLSWRQNEKETTAGQALSQLVVTPPANAAPGQMAARYLKIAGDYSDTLSGQRALLLGAAALFEAGDYTGAQTQFQKFVDSFPASSFASTAVLGVAAALEAQGKPNAADLYQQVLDNYHDPVAMISANFALGRINERQGKTAEAIKYYQQVARSASRTTLGQEAGVKIAELTAAMPPKVVSSSSTAPADLAAKLNAIIAASTNAAKSNASPAMRLLTTTNK
jgi:predicted negative regulator of RcsB-dependent stress response